MEYEPKIYNPNKRTPTILRLRVYEIPKQISISAHFTRIQLLRDHSGFICFSFKIFYMKYALLYMPVRTILSRGNLYANMFMKKLNRC